MAAYAKVKSNIYSSQRVCASDSHENVPIHSTYIYLTGGCGQPSYREGGRKRLWGNVSDERRVCVCCQQPSCFSSLFSLSCSQLHSGSPLPGCMACDGDLWEAIHGMCQQLI